MKMNKKLFFILLSIIIFVSNCSLAPKYVKPAAPIPQEWPQGEAYDNNTLYNSASSNVPNIKWQDFFTDNRLQKIIELSLSYNRDLQIAALNVERSRALYGISRAELFPVISADGSWSKTRVPASLTNTGKSMTEEQYNVNLGITSWELDFFGRIRSLKEQALQEYMATEQAKRSTQISLISEIARMYLALGADLENLRLAQDTLQTQQDVYNIIKARYEVGLATEIDLSQVQTQLDTARENVATYTQLAALDKNALDLLMGSQCPEELLPNEMGDTNLFKNISAGITSSILLNRPDILQAEYQLKAAFANIGAARAAFFPMITLTTFFGTASDELSGLFNAGSDTWSFSPKINLPVFDMRTWASLRVSKTDREIARTNYEKAIQTAFREVADTLAVAGTIDRQVNAQESIVYSTNTIYNLSTERYMQGIDNYLSVLDAQRNLYAAQQSLISLRLTKLANQVKLYEVLGGGSD